MPDSQHDRHPRRLTGDETPDVVILTSDFTYADTYKASYAKANTHCTGPCTGGVNQQRWDTFLKLMQPLLAAFPLTVIHVAGNHEIEPGAGCYLSANSGVWYPSSPTPKNTMLGGTISTPTIDFGPANPCFQVSGPASGDG